MIEIKNEDEILKAVGLRLTGGKKGWPRMVAIYGEGSKTNASMNDILSITILDQLITLNKQMESISGQLESIYSEARTDK